MQSSNGISPNINICNGMDPNNKKKKKADCSIIGSVPLLMAAATATAGGAMGSGPCFRDEAEAVSERAAAKMKDAQEWADLEPLFFDEAAAVADHKREMRREQRKREEEAHKKKLAKAYRAASDRIREYDPKHGSTYFTRIDFVDLLTFDHDEESPLAPMRETEALIYVDGVVCKEGRKQFFPGDSANTLDSDCGNQFIANDSLDGKMEFVPCNSANVLSVKIISSDVGFPIDVYGTIIARDSLDLKCVYLFRRDRDHCQLILTKDESLIVTGPKRGLALLDDIYFEIDLKIKGVGGQRDKQLSKGYLTLDGIQSRYLNEMAVDRRVLNTRLSKVAITYAVVKYAVEATFAVEVVQGRFYGEITACTSSIRDSIVLHDSRLAEATDAGKGVIQLLRRVVAVHVKEKLIVTVVAWTGDGKTKSTTTKFTPGLNGADEKEISCGFMKMRVKVTWSLIEREYLRR